jgi:hypothetical protein
MAALVSVAITACAKHNTCMRGCGALTCNQTPAKRIPGHTGCYAQTITHKNLTYRPAAPTSGVCASPAALVCCQDSSRHLYPCDTCGPFLACTPTPFSPHRWSRTATAVVIHHARISCSHAPCPLTIPTFTPSCSFGGTACLYISKPAAAKYSLYMSTPVCAARPMGARRMWSGMPNADTWAVHGHGRQTVRHLHVCVWGGGLDVHVRTCVLADGGLDLR